MSAARAAAESALVAPTGAGKYQAAQHIGVATAIRQGYVAAQAVADDIDVWVAFVLDEALEETGQIVHVGIQHGHAVQGQHGHDHLVLLGEVFEERPEVAKGPEKAV